MFGQMAARDNYDRDENKKVMKDFSHLLDN